MTAQFNSLEQFGRTCIERTLALQTAASKAVQAVAAEAADYAKASIEQSTAALEQLVASKTPDKFVESQIAYAKSVQEALVARAKKLVEISAVFTKEAFPPIGA